MSRLLMFCVGVLITFSSSGCCLTHGGCGAGYNAPYGGGCNNGCAPTGYAPGGYPSAGLYGGGMPATAFAVPAATTAGYTPYYPQAAMMMPLDPLATR